MPDLGRMLVATTLAAPLLVYAGERYVASRAVRAALLCPVALALFAAAPHFVSYHQNLIAVQSISCILACCAFKVLALCAGRGVLAAELNQGAGWWRFMGAFLLPVVPTGPHHVPRKRAAREGARKLVSALAKLLGFAAISLCSLAVLYWGDLGQQLGQQPGEACTQQLGQQADMAGVSPAQQALPGGQAGSASSLDKGLGGAAGPLLATAWLAPALAQIGRLALYYLSGVTLWLQVAGMGDLLDAVALVGWGIEAEPHFNNPFMAPSLGEFWGRRWNLTISSLLRPLAYDPIVEGHLLPAATGGARTRAAGVPTSPAPPAAAPALTAAAAAAAAAGGGAAAAAAAAAANAKAKAGASTPFLTTPTAPASPACVLHPLTCHAPGPAAVKQQGGEGGGRQGGEGEVSLAACSVASSVSDASSQGSQPMTLVWEGLLPRLTSSPHRRHRQSSSSSSSSKEVSLGGWVVGGGWEGGEGKAPCALLSSSRRAGSGRSSGEAEGKGEGQPSLGPCLASYPLTPAGHSGSSSWVSSRVSSEASLAALGSGPGGEAAHSGSSSSSSSSGDAAGAGAEGLAHSPRGPPARRQRRKLWGGLATFLLSGLWHELVFMHISGGHTTGGAWLLFFIIQAPLIALESAVKRRARQAGLLPPRWLQVVVTNIVLMLAISTLWVPPLLQPLPTHTSPNPGLPPSLPAPPLPHQDWAGPGSCRGEGGAGSSQAAGGAGQGPWLGAAGSRGMLGWGQPGVEGSCAVQALGGPGSSVLQVVLQQAQRELQRLGPWLRG